MTHPRSSERGIVALQRTQRGLKEAMERGEASILIKAWRCIALILITPITIVPGLHAVVLLISSVCVLFDDWSLEGAAHNFALGFPGMAAISALWFSTFSRPSWLVRDTYRFVLVTTGLLVGLVLECLLLRAGVSGTPSMAPRVGLYETWVFGGAFFVGGINLVALIAARNRIDAPKAVARDPIIPGPHVAVEATPHPVKLEPYRPPVSTRPKQGPTSDTGRHVPWLT
jgi:hypothetical protein